MTVLDNYTDQVRDGVVYKPGVDPVQGGVAMLHGHAAYVTAVLQAFPYDESRIVGPLGAVLRMVANLASQLGLSLEQLAVADITELEKTQPGTFSVEGLGDSSSADLKEVGA